MKWLIYDAAFALAFPFLLPGFLARMLRRGGYRERMADRFALYPVEVRARLEATRGKAVWVHAVSVGEVQVALQLMEEWRRQEPDVAFVFSTTSSTGWKIAKEKMDARDTLIYNPLDFPNFVKSALRAVEPRALVLTESEIWPCFIRRAAKSGAMVFLANARVSDRSAPRYARARRLFKDVFALFSRIFAQSDLDRRRILAAGAKDETVETTGSFKFDVAARAPAKEEEMRAWIARAQADKGCAPETGIDARILLAASTWPGEDVAALEILKTLPEDVTLVIAPRHFEKADTVEANIRAAGFNCVRRSRGDTRANGIRTSHAGARTVFLADTTGELMGLYGIADAVFVGKSLCEHGSQNMIEPCLCGKPTVVGPYTENFRPVMSDLLAQDAIVQVQDSNELGETIRAWFADEARAKALGERAARAVASRKGVVPRCVAEMRAQLESQSRRKAPSSEHGKGRKWSIGKHIAWWGIVALAALAILHLGDFAPERDWEKEMQEAREEFRYKPVATIMEFLPKLEDPLGEGVAVSQVIDASKLTMDEFCTILGKFPSPRAHLWMVTEQEWLLTGRKGEAATNRVPLAAMLELFDDPDNFERLAEAQCSALPDFFASYAGERNMLAGAFGANDPASQVRPEYFTTREIPPLDWLDSDGVDPDIRDIVLREIRSMQVVRRNVIEGNMLAQAGNMDDAIEKWAAAMLRNPNDTMLLARLHRLAVNAVAFHKVGNVKAATKCYETMVCVRPADYVAIEQYAQCLRQLGETQLADQAMARAKTLRAALEEKDENSQDLEQ